MCIRDRSKVEGDLIQLLVLFDNRLRMEVAKMCIRDSIGAGLYKQCVNNGHRVRMRPLKHGGGLFL